MRVVKKIRKNKDLEKIKQIEVTDIRKLLSERISYISPEISRLSNAIYGIEYQLKRYAGIDMTMPFNCTIEHGLYFTRTVSQYEVMHHTSHILTFSSFRAEVIKELTDIIPIAIGPYIAYAEDYRSKEYVKEMKERNGKVLLVMPSHSIQGLCANYNILEFIQKIEEVRKLFDKVVVCLYWEDLKRGVWKIYKEHGYTIVSAGNPCNPLFLSRLKYVLGLCDAVIANSVTTGVAYAMYMDKPVSLTCQEINYEAERSVNMFEIEGESKKGELLDLLCNDKFELNDEQRIYGRYVFGLEEVKTKNEMKKILTPLLRKVN